MDSRLDGPFGTHGTARRPTAERPLPARASRRIMVAVKGKSLLGLVVIVAVIFGYYSWAKPHTPKRPPSVPHTVTIHMPDPIGG